MSNTTKWLVLAMLVFAAGGPGQAMGGDITYQLINYPDYQNGWTLTGSITTDGKAGAISSGDIVSWTYTITKGVNEYTVSSTNGSAIASDLDATTSQLTLPYPSSPIPGAQLSLSGFAQQNSNVELSLQWSYPLSPYYECVTISPSFQYEWQTPLPLHDTTSAVIATVVPEPASIVLTGLASACGLACVVVRRIPVCKTTH